ncbi:MAG: acyl-CoA/acyl-ACP dehydrogenase, partial [Proteobacteria bacterium]|nr:acyl-CoA/acyl-ACP dehydrogenase [Pseudomonadota bacterium]
LRASVLDSIHRHTAALARADGVDEHNFAIAMSTLKITAGELAVEVVENAMQVCGLAGYRNDSQLSVTRHLRDAYSALIMINNDRIAANIAAALTVGRLGDALSA